MIIILIISYVYIYIYIYIHIYIYICKHYVCIHECIRGWSERGHLAMAVHTHALMLLHAICPRELSVLRGHWPDSNYVLSSAMNLHVINESKLARNRKRKQATNLKQHKTRFRNAARPCTPLAMTTTLLNDSQFVLARASIRGQLLSVRGRSTWRLSPASRCAPTWWAYIYIYIYVYIHKCVHTRYIYIYIVIYIYIYTYIYI